MCCPNCDKNHYYKNGLTKAGRQRYICRYCHKSFSDTIDTIVFHSKKPYNVWKQFIECELKHMSLRDTADELGISTTCAFNWRHKLYKAIEKYVTSDKLSGNVYVDSTYININLKGTKPRNMPRFSKKRPGSAYRGLSSS